MTIPIFTPPLSLTYPQKRSPMWKTLHQEAISGRDNPLALWTYPRYKYEIPFSALRSGAAYLTQQYVMAFYNSVNGSSGVFQYNDVDDNTVTNQTFAVGDGVTTTFQLARTLPGSVAFTEPVLAPVTVVVKVNGVITAVTVNAGGTVTFGSPPALGTTLTWTGTFNWLCRFDDDSAEFQKDFAGIWAMSKLSFTTIKL